MDAKPESNEPVAGPEAKAPAPPKEKKSRAKRIIKGLLWFLGGLLVFVVVALLTLPLWINPVGTSLAGAIVPFFTGTAFNLERINLNPYTGKLFISGVKLANPEGYAEKEAFTLGSLSVDVEVSSLLSDTIHVRDITIDSPFASYVFDAAGSNNFDRIIAAVNKRLGPKKKEKEPSETKVVLDKVTVKNVRAVVGLGVFELASHTLADFGKDTPAKLEVAGVKLVNPEGFPEPDAFSLKSLSIGMETGDLSKKPLVFHDILVDSTYAGLVYDDAGTSNIDAMFKPLMGDEKEGEKKDEKKEDEKKAEAEDGGPRVVIDKLDIAATKLQYRKVSLPIPLPTFTDIGKGSKEGATAKEVAEQVVAKARDALGGLGNLVGVLGNDATNLLGNATGTLGAGATNLLGNAKGLIGAGATNLLSNATGLVGGSVSNVLGGATSAITGGASNVLSGAKGLLGNVLPGGEKKKDDEPSAADKAVEGAKDALKKLGTGGGLFGN
jgi:hypothetical protein